MSLSAQGIIEVRPSGSDTQCAGLFNPDNANFLTDLAATSGTTTAPVVTSASYNFVAGDVGAWVYVKSGTNWIPGWYKISSVASNAATLDATLGHACLAKANVSSNMVFAGLSTANGCATAGSPTGGTWSIDYSQQNASQFNGTDLLIDAVTNTKVGSL